MTSFWTRSYFHCQFSVCFTTRCHHCLWFLYLLYIYKLQDIVPKHPYPWQEYQKKKNEKETEAKETSSNGRLSPSLAQVALGLHTHWNDQYEVKWNGSLLSCTPAYGLPEMLHIRKCTSAIDLNKWYWAFDCQIVSHYANLLTLLITY